MISEENIKDVLGIMKSFVDGIIFGMGIVFLACAILWLCGFWDAPNKSAWQTDKSTSPVGTPYLVGVYPAGTKLPKLRNGEETTTTTTTLDFPNRAPMRIGTEPMSILIEPAQTGTLVWSNSGAFILESPTTKWTEYFIHTAIKSGKTYPPHPTPGAIFLSVPEEYTNYELGLRSDGVVVWRKVEKK